MDKDHEDDRDCSFAEHLAACCDGEKQVIPEAALRASARPPQRWLRAMPVVRQKDG